MKPEQRLVRALREALAAAEAMAGMPKDGFVRMSEALRRTGAGRSTLRDWWRSGRMPRPKTIGARTPVWPRDVFDAWERSR